MSTVNEMTPEESFMADILPIFKQYLLQRQTHLLDDQINQTEEQLQSLQQSRADHLLVSRTDVNEMKTSLDASNRPRKELKDQEKESDKLLVDLTIRDLKDDVQEFIIGSLGYESVDDLLSDRPEMDGVILTLEV